VQHPRMALAGAGASALLCGTAFTVWNQSNVNEKVYTLSVLVGAAVSWLALLWYDRRDQPGSYRYLLVALYLIVLGSTNHLMSVLPAPALGLFVLLAGPAVLMRGGLWLRAIPLVVLGLSFNLFLPIRAAQDPVINEGEPVCAAAGEALVAVFTNGKTGCPALAANLRRDQYAKPPVTQRNAAFSHQLLNYFQYFDWQWGRGAAPAPQPGNARMPLTLVFLALGGVGLYAVFRSNRLWFAYLGSLTALLTVGLVFYLNFKHGFSLAPEVTSSELHEVRERDYFFIGSFGLWGVLAGIGLTWVWSRMVAALARPKAVLVTAPILLVALVPLALNWSWASRAGDWSTRDWAYDLLMSVEPYAILFTNGDNDTFPLWYMQEVEGVRPDVTVIVGQYLHTLWYPKQLQRLTTPDRQRPFVAPEGVTLYQDPGLPAASISTAPGDVFDRVFGGTLAEDIDVAFPAMSVTYPAGTLLDRGHRLALAIIRESYGKRPIYFATTGGMMGQLGLHEWGVRHGLANKLVMLPQEQLDMLGYVKVSDELGAERFDVPRSLELYQNVYGYRGLKSRTIWPDRSTDNIPLQFYLLALQMAEALRRTDGSEELIEQLERDAVEFRISANGGAILLVSD
jgi:hypothetical protein